MNLTPTEFCELRRQIIGYEFDQMNDSQKEAVFHTQGPLLILAGAGSGKTTVLVNRIANLLKYGEAYHSSKMPQQISKDDQALLSKAAQSTALDETECQRLQALLAVNPVRPWQMLAITFTNKAAGELKERLERMVGEGAQEIWATTFHSACARILRRHADRLGFNSRFTIYDTDDSRRLMKECQRILDIDDKLLPHRAILNAIGRAKDSLLSPQQFAQTAGSDYRLKRYSEAYVLYQKRLKEANAMDFDDLIYHTVRLLEDNEDILSDYQERFRYILVDEYQDTNHAQYVLIKTLAKRYKNICVVGDDNQSIYRFRGATIENILDFEKQYRDAKTVRLEQNYRSTQTILDAANAVIRNNTRQKEKNLWTQNGPGEKIQMHTAHNEQGEAHFVADCIQEQVRNGRRYADNAILYRMNAQSNALEKTFVREGIPYRIIGGLKFYDRKEIKDVLAYLNVINNPTDNLRLRRIINEPRRGIGETTLNHAMEICNLSGLSLFEVMQNATDYPALSRAATRLKDFASIMHSLMDAASQLPPHSLLELMLDRTGYMAALRAQGEEAAERIENVNELSSSLIQYENEEPEGSLAGFLEEISLMSDIDSFNAATDAVAMMTMHSAKGLEFPFVYIVGMEDGIFPGAQSIYAGAAELEEERRLAYVGITRAKEVLRLTNATTRMMFGTTSRNRPSRFLAEIPSELLDASAVFDNASNAPLYKTHALGEGKNDSRQSRAFQSAGTHLIGSAASSPTFRPGDRVVHKTFGNGLVMVAQAMGNDTLLTIAFDRVGTKKLMANFARLEQETE